MPKTSPPAVTLPLPEPTVESCQAASKAIWDALSKGQITPNQHKQLDAGIRTVLSAIKISAGLTEMTEIRAMLKQAEEAARLRREFEVMDRFSSSSEIGEFSVTDEDEDD